LREGAAREAMVVSYSHEAMTLKPADVQRRA